MANGIGITKILAEWNYAKGGQMSAEKLLHVILTFKTPAVLLCAIYLSELDLVNTPSMNRVVNCMHQNTTATRTPSITHC